MNIRVAPSGVHVLVGKRLEMQPELELPVNLGTWTMQRPYGCLNTDWWVPGLRCHYLAQSDQYCLLGARGVAVVQHERGEQIYRYQACHLDQWVQGLIVYQSTFFMIQDTTITEVIPSCPVSQMTHCDFIRPFISPFHYSLMTSKVTHYVVPCAQRLQKGLALDAHTLALVDSHAGHVIKYHPRVNNVEVLANRLSGPVAISQLGQGYQTLFFVTEYRGNRVKVYDATWTPLHTIGREGHGNGELSDPVDTAVTPYNTLLVADNGNRRISEFTTDGDFLRQVLEDLEGAPCSISMQGRHLWVLLYYDDMQYTLARYALHR